MALNLQQTIEGVVTIKLMETDYKKLPIIFSNNDYSSYRKNNIENNMNKYLVISKKDYWYSLENGLFIIPYNEFLILYQVVEMRRNILILDNKIDEIFNHKNIFKFLEANLDDEINIGLVNSEIDFNKNKNIGKDINQDFLGLMLSLTSACNLRCSYCYIEGGEEKSNMSWELAKLAIDYISERCVQNKLKNFSLSFHGQGEPTLNWKLLCQAVEYSTQKCEEYSLNPEISLVTNGLIDKKQIEYLKKYSIKTTISMDCSTETLNLLRPMRNGEDILPKLINTLENFQSLNFDFNIRSTVSDLNVFEMIDFIKFLSNYTNCKKIKFELITLEGRAKNTKLSDDLYENFVSNFHKAETEANIRNVNVSYGNLGETQRDTFCNSIGKNLNYCVSTKGMVSSCYEHLGDNLNDPFIYGRYENGELTLFKHKYDSLLNKEPLKDECKKCFLATTCAGGCYSRISLNPMLCYVNREIIKKNLFTVATSKLNNEDHMT